MKNVPSLWWGGSLSPARELTRLQRQIDQLFDDFLTVPAELTRGMELYPECDIDETENAYLLKMDVPGVKKEDLKVEFKDNQLFVSGERKEEHEEKGKAGYRHERRYGSFQRVFALPNVGEAEKVEAAFKDGVLTVTLPKSAASKSIDIKVKEGLLEPQKTKAA